MTNDTSRNYFPGWARFDLGDFQCTVITDGPFDTGAPAGAFVGAEEEELIGILHDAFLPTDVLTLEQNMLLLDTGKQLVLFDSGCGSTPRFGGKLFGATTGKVIENLRTVGVSADDIDVVALTHAHPDHSWGLTDPDGNPIYKNARVLINQTEFEHWTNLDNIRQPEFAKDTLTIEGAHANLMPYKDRISFVSDGDEPIPGTTVRLAAGHSPGHTMYDIQSQGQRLVHWGDVAHHPVLIARPDLSIVFDFDPKQAAQSRMKVLDWVARERIEVFACHFGFPGRGHIRKASGAYDWAPTRLNTLQS